MTPMVVGQIESATAGSGGSGGRTETATVALIDPIVATIVVVPDLTPRTCSWSLMLRSRDRQTTTRISRVLGDSSHRTPVRRATPGRQRPD